MDTRVVADRLRALAEKNAVPGAQLVVHTGTETVSVATGVTHAGRPEPVDTSTAFALGSVTKAFTATLLVQLASDGDVDLDEPVAELLPELRRAADASLAEVTARHLLTHTGGLIADHELDDPAERSLLRYTTSVAALPLLDRPGRGFSYANTGYNVLGRVVEEVTGLKWHEALRDFLLRPLGLDPVLPHTTATEPSGRVLAHGHAVRPGTPGAHPVDQLLPATWAPASGLSASAEDLLVFARLHTGRHPEADTLLDDEHRALMHTPDPAADSFGMADGWAPGLGCYGGPDNRWLGHDGTVDGGTCNLRFHPGTGAAVALTTNATTGSSLWLDVVEELRSLGLDVADHDPGLPPGPATGATAPDPAPVLGDYANGDTVFSVRRHEGGVRLSDRTGLVADVTLHDGLYFTARRVDAGQAPYAGRFLPDGDTGEVTLLRLAGRSARRLPPAA
ncbi:serine hydrolase [Streptomyces mashuensis]|uniref:Serine hydrolase n=1 Tax=Streptomyces mashuensis TaxID=33904 RepID=A0A919AT01_9ACTN|nr:serine hydrolase domain-containing protein [Streptomyces mashuensis]GHF24644.1 serine hydrolase [Streptomyces mashuensis]